MRSPVHMSQRDYTWVVGVTNLMIMMATMATGTMESTRIKEALRKEGEFLKELKKATEEQIAILKAERVILERQVLHHSGQRSTSANRSITLPIQQQSSIESPHLPVLNLDLPNRAVPSQKNGNEEEEEED
ncbi:PREDICTED: uncharacterized protein LOC109580245 [Amphimedon queenslandica]|uniref:Uncharacterized protein n=1 Tax=Amphimedon queenslandica TaxID=400682 RepID=A0A1X7VIT0_AMPQE|nr:PREDICTED: uncharacterized protein LOC109580245 [Amphimedon queenslandica]|eukprot:XP_019848783.1 PREDICTED: uncharacterized protein LOC109580245 [Amphimedon queenslandica]